MSRGKNTTIKHAMLDKPNKKFNQNRTECRRRRNLTLLRASLQRRVPLVGMIFCSSLCARGAVGLRFIWSIHRPRRLRAVPFRIHFPYYWIPSDFNSETPDVRWHCASRIRGGGGERVKPIVGRSSERRHAADGGRRWRRGEGGSRAVLRASDEEAPRTAAEWKRMTPTVRLIVSPPPYAGSRSAAHGRRRCRSATVRLLKRRRIDGH